MAQMIEVNVPDIGGYGDVPVIELLVQPGDRVAKDQGLLTLESDKATMEVPSSAAGVVRELKVRVGDTVSEGAVVAVLAAAGESAAVAPAPSAQAPKAPAVTPPAQRAMPAPASPAATGRKADIECQVLVLGAGPGG